MSYAIYIGGNHTADGIAYLAGYGDEPSSHWLDIHPGQTHAKNSTITVGVTEHADLPGRLKDIPQAQRTLRNIRVEYSYYKGVPAPLTNGWFERTRCLPSEMSGPLPDLSWLQ